LNKFHQTCKQFIKEKNEADNLTVPAGSSIEQEKLNLD